MEASELAKTIKDARELKKWSINDLSRRSSVPEALIQIIEEGQHNVGDILLAKLAASLEIDAQELLPKKD